MTDTGTDNRRRGFFIIDNEVFDHYDLNPLEGWLYIAIVRHINQQSGIAFPSLKTLAKECRMSKPTVIKSLQGLKDKKLITIEQQKSDKPGEYKPNHYTLIGVVKEIYHPSKADLPGVVKEVDSNNTKSKKTKDQEPPQSVGPQSNFGYTIGDTAWWVDEKDYRVTLYDGKITRFTAKMVEFTYVVDGKEYSTLRKPGSLSKEQPTLRRKTTPLQDMIALHLFNIEPNVAVGKQLAIRLKTIEGEIRTSYPNLTALDFKFACAFAGKYIPRDTPKVLAMIGEFYKTKNGSAPAPSTTTAHDTRTQLGLVDA